MRNIDIKLLVAFLVGGLLMPPSALLYTTGFQKVMSFAQSTGQPQIAYKAEQW